MRFIAAAFSLVLSAALAAAQATAPLLNTPQAVQECFNSELTWTAATAGPFQISVIDYNSRAVLEELGSNITGTRFVWLCKQPALTEIFLRLKDTSTGQISETAHFPVGTGTSGCAAAGSSSAASAPSVSQSGGSVPVASSPATSSQAAPGTTPAPTTAGSNTGTSKPQSSNTSKTSSGAASSPSGGAGQLKAPVALAVAAAFGMTVFA